MTVDLTPSVTHVERSACWRAERLILALACRATSAGFFCSEFSFRPASRRKLAFCWLLSSSNSRSSLRVSPAAWRVVLQLAATIMTMFQNPAGWPFSAACQPALVVPSSGKLHLSDSQFAEHLPCSHPSLQLILISKGLLVYKESLLSMCLYISSVCTRSEPFLHFAGMTMALWVSISVSAFPTSSNHVHGRLTQTWLLVSLLPAHVHC